LDQQVSSKARHNSGFDASFGYRQKPSQSRAVTSKRKKPTRNQTNDLNTADNFAVT